MDLKAKTKAEIERLGGIRHGGDYAEASLAFCRGVIWPKDYVYATDVSLLRRALGEQVPSIAAWEDQAVIDEFGSVESFRFNLVDPSDSRELLEDFPAVDPLIHYPFGGDSYYYFFLSKNSEDPSDPLVLAIDHEETDDEPLETGVTLGQFLASLARI